MGCLGKCVLIIINSIFMLISVIFMAVGVILVFLPGKFLDKAYESVKEEYEKNTNNVYKIPDSADDLADVPFLKTLGTGMLVFGIALFIISFMAYLGACCTTCCRCLLVLYSIVVIVFILIEVTVGILFFISSSPVHDEIKSKLKGLIKDEYKDNGTDTFSLSMNMIHQYFDCCGIDNGMDFGTKEHRSCEPKYESTGCYSKLQDVINDHQVWCFLGLGALVLLQVLEVICAISLYKENKIMPI